MIKKLYISIILIFFSLNFFSQESIRYHFLTPISKNEIFIRIFKYEKQLEVWTKNEYDSEFKLYKKYNVCFMSGGFGPKRCEGDLQVPEGFYYINDFNFHSNYKLSLGINYPNESDKILSKCKNPGGLIYIHGDCVSVGCISMKENIDEIFNLALKAKMNGQEQIPVHIFPINYHNFNSLRFFEEKITQNQNLVDFEKNIFDGFIYFEDSSYLPKVTVNEYGKYIFN